MRNPGRQRNRDRKQLCKNDADLLLAIENQKDYSKEEILSNNPFAEKRTITGES